MNMIQKSTNTPVAFIFFLLFHCVDYIDLYRFFTCLDKLYSLFESFVFFCTEIKQNDFFNWIKKSHKKNKLGEFSRFSVRREPRQGCLAKTDGVEGLKNIKMSGLHEWTF